MEFSRQEYWSGLLCPPPWDVLNRETEPVSPVTPALQVILYHLATEQGQAPPNGTVLAHVRNLMHGSKLGTQWSCSSETSRAAASESHGFAMYLAGL